MVTERVVATILTPRGEDDISTDSEQWAGIETRPQETQAPPFTRNMGHGDIHNSGDAEESDSSGDSYGVQGRRGSITNLVSYSQISFGPGTLSDDVDDDYVTSNSSEADIQSERRQIYQPRDEANRKISYRITLHEDSATAPDRLQPEVFDIFGVISNHRFPDGVRILGQPVTGNTDKPAWSDHALIRWVHVQSDAMKSDEIKEAVRSRNHQNGIHRAIASRLLSKAEETKMGTYPGGKFLGPGTVLGGEETGDHDQRFPACGIFASIPYLGTSTIEAATAKDCFPSRGLLQTLYPFQDVGDREKEQVVRSQEIGDEGIIRVPQLWALSLTREPDQNADVLITYGTLPMDKLCGSQISRCFIETSRPGHMIVRFTDRLGQSLLFEMPRGQTFLELEAAISRRIRAIQSDDLSKDFDLYAGMDQTDRIKVLNSLLTRNASILIIREIADHSHVQVKFDFFTQNERIMQDPSPVIENSTVLPFFHWATQTHPQRGEGRYLDFAEALLRTYQAPELEGVHSKIATIFTSGSWVSGDKTERSVLDLIDQISAEQPDLRLPEDADAGHMIKSIIQKRRVNILEALKQYAQKFADIMDCFVSQEQRQGHHRAITSGWTSMYSVATITKDAIDQTSDLGSFNLEATNRLWYATDRESPGVLQKTSTASYISSLRPIERQENMIPEPCQPTVPISACKSCNRQQPYRTPNRLIRHLRKKHFVSQSNQSTIRPEWEDVRLSLWMNDETRWGAEETLHCLSYLLDIATNTLERAHMDLLHNKHGVCTPSGTRHVGYTLHRTLLDAFVQAIAFAEAVHIAADTIRSEMAEGENSNHRGQNVRAVSYAFLAVTHFGRSVLEAIKTARHKLYAMTREPSDSKLHDSLTYGPNVVLGCIAQTLYQRSIVQTGAAKTAGASSIYRQAFDRIKWEANRRPNKKVLREIARLQEELTALSRVNMWQWNAINKLRMLSDDDTFYKSDPRRKREHLRIKWMTKRTARWLDLESKEYHDMIRMCLPLAEQTKQGVEIYEEDHGKLLFVFTVVTVVFLPLSFVTGYFGMNTVDMRNTTWEQNRFWAIAIPVTVVVVAVTWATASLGDTWAKLVANSSTGDRKSKRQALAAGPLPYVDYQDELARDPTEDDETIVLEEAEFRALSQTKSKAPPTQTPVPTSSALLTQPSLARRNDWDDTFLPLGETDVGYTEAVWPRNELHSTAIGGSEFDPLNNLIGIQESRGELERIPETRSRRLSI